MTLDGIFVKGMGTVLVIVQIIICLLQLMGSSSSPAFLVFVGYSAYMTTHFILNVASRNAQDA